MQTLVTIIHVLAALFLIVVVLLQSGKGGIGMLGGSNTNVFGARGAGNFLTKLTAACAVIFFLTSLTLSIMSSKLGSVVQSVKTAPVPAAPSDNAVAPPPAGASDGDKMPAANDKLPATQPGMP